MPDATTLVLLTLFACPPGATAEATCGPATGNYATASMAECIHRGYEYQREQAQAMTDLRRLRFTCWVPGMGMSP